ncbi:hypothetical protein MOMUL_30840 [Moorella mulderi DSM 14980]|uniref:Integrase catalytic domain-containing protein n=1 Tax=Moorella mulderi DSM 14980 TaxID=1122241 RepID=A0A151AQ18_9FIRM|nr:hypothetical protein MOMUL_30840 [Moorella mulderi DSM 14980]
MQLAQTKYRGCNYTFLSELLREHEGICLSPASVGRILKAAGILSPRKHRPPKPHCRRPRKPQLGMLVQIDGSHHDWLEGRGPWLVLLLAIDDATGRILSALFWPAEDFEGYCRLLYQLISQHGIPLAIYSDRHTLFFSPKEKQDHLTLEEQFLGERRSLTQIGRILRDLVYQPILPRLKAALSALLRLCSKGWLSNSAWLAPLPLKRLTPYFRGLLSVTMKNSPFPRLKLFRPSAPFLLICAWNISSPGRNIEP